LERLLDETGRNFHATVHRTTAEAFDVADVGVDADADDAHDSADDAGLMANRSGAGEGQLRYQQYLGRRPYHGQYRIVAQDGRGDRVDSITIEFNCFPPATTGEGNETTG
ncbi:hypothetical protein ACFQE1_20485, partial [Halobium palmae]